jgi:transcriptional regulator with PAS, ATPase and Fis domain
MQTEHTSMEELQKELFDARASKDEQRIIEILEVLTKKYETAENWSDFLDRATELLVYYHKGNYALKEVKLLMLIGRGFDRLADFNQAMEYQKRALNLLNDLDEDLLTARAYRDIGVTYRNIGKYDESVSALTAALDIYQKNRKLLNLPEHKEDKAYLGNTLESLGVLWSRLEHEEEARKYFHQALEVYEEINQMWADAWGVAKCLNNIAISYSEVAPKKAIDYYKKALKVAEDNNFEIMIAPMVNNIGAVYEDMGDYNKALEYYRKALDLDATQKNHHFRATFLKHIGKMFMKKQEFNMALTYLNKSLELFQEHNQLEHVQDIYYLFSQCYKGKEDYKTALEYFEKYDEMQESMFSEELKEKLSGLQQKYEESKKVIQELKQYNSLISETLKHSINMNLIGKSKQIKDVLDVAMLAASNANTNVLIGGESGTGKEIIAHIIHYASARKEKLFIPVNCSSIPESLAESEFFGYVAGAFTGAVKDRAGYIELANEGTLFLDEIGDMPAPIQAKLLRALESKKIKRLGSEKEIEVDFRIVAATNKNIDQLIEKNKFRLDLLYRLNTIEIYIPPLRERIVDIEPLLNFFVEEFSISLKKPKPKIASEVLKKLKTYRFPGNVRELRNMVEKAMILMTADALSPDDFILKQYGAEKETEKIPPLTTIAEMEKQMILNALRQTNNNKTEAAKILGISRSTFIRKCKAIESN